MKQVKSSRFKRYLAQKETDDARIVDAIARNQRGTLRFVTEKGEARFNVK